MKHQRTKLALLFAGLITVPLFLFPGVAQAAAGVSSSGGSLRIETSAGAANRITVSLVNSTFSITDTGDVVPVGVGCTSLNRHTAHCTAAGVTRVQINAGDQDDIVVSNVPFETTVNAGLGNDEVTTSVADDTLNGGDGDDILSGGEGTDRLRGNAGSDTLSGGPGFRDTLDGGEGPDVLSGGDGDSDIADYESRTAGVTASLNDIADDGEIGELDNVRSDVEDITGGAGNDTLTGSNVRNHLVGNDGHDVLTGLAGNDNIFSGAGNDTLNGGEGNDDFGPGLGQDVVNGGPDRDEVFYSERAVRVEVTLNDDIANDGEVGEKDNIHSDVEDLMGGSGFDSLTGNNSDNRIVGGSGNDFISTLGGDDFISGEAGNDTAEGGDDNDVVTGGADNDTLRGAKGADDVFGNDGDDFVSGGVIGAGNDGADNLSGGFGNDTAEYGDHGGVPVTVSIDGVANDGATGQNEGDDVDLDIEKINGGLGDDTLVGNDQPNGLFGRNGNDTLFGRGGDDTLFGEIGSDNLFGDAGNDHLDCGPQVDFGDGGAHTVTDTAVACETVVNVP